MRLRCDVIWIGSSGETDFSFETLELPASFSGVVLFTSLVFSKVFETDAAFSNDLSFCFAFCTGFKVCFGFSGSFCGGFFVESFFEIGTFGAELFESLLEATVGVLLLLAAFSLLGNDCLGFDLTVSDDFSISLVILLVTEFERFFEDVRFPSAVFASSLLLMLFGVVIVVADVTVFGAITFEVLLAVFLSIGDAKLRSRLALVDFLAVATGLGGGCLHER